MEMRWVAMSSVTGRLFQVDPVARLNTSLQLTLHDHRTGIDICFDAPVRPDGQPGSSRIDGTFHFTVYVEVLAAREFPSNHNRLADESHFCAGGLRHFGSFHE